VISVSPFRCYPPPVSVLSLTRPVRRADPSYTEQSETAPPNSALRPLLGRSSALGSPEYFSSRQAAWAYARPLNASLKTVWSQVRILPGPPTSLVLPKGLRDVAEYPRTFPIFWVAFLVRDVRLCGVPLAYRIKSLSGSCAVNSIDVAARSAQRRRRRVRLWLHKIRK
jgi:hypothetical protein